MGESGTRSSVLTCVPADRKLRRSTEAVWPSKVFRQLPSDSAHRRSVLSPVERPSLIEGQVGAPECGDKLHGTNCCRPKSEEPRRGCLRMWEVMKRGAGSDHGGEAQSKQFEISCKLSAATAAPQTCSTRMGPQRHTCQTWGAHSLMQRCHAVCRRWNLLSRPSRPTRAAGSPEAVATHWSTGEKATAQMPRLWPRRVTVSTRSGMRHTCTQAAHLSAPASCTGSCCARNPCRVGRVSGDATDWLLWELQRISQVVLQQLGHLPPRG